MIEKLNTSNISILQTNTAEEIGIKSIANGVKDNLIAKTLVEQAGTDPNKVTKSTVSILESIMCLHVGRCLQYQNVPINSKLTSLQ